MPELAETTLVGLLDAAPDALVAVDQCGRIVLVNLEAERLFGYRRDELIGQLAELLVPADARRIAPDRRPMRTGDRLAGRRKDGTNFPADISLSAITTDDGIVVCAAIRDATEGQSAEAKFHAVLEAAPDAMICVDQGGCITLVNAQAERLFGYERPDLVGQRVEVLVPDAARVVHPAHRAAFFADPSPRPMGTIRVAGRRRDGSEFPAEISLIPLEAEDGLWVSATIRDVTAQLEAQAERDRLRSRADLERFENELHQSRRMESLGQLAGGVAHDFNNLLAVILNYASFVAEEITHAAAAPGGANWAGPLRDMEQIRLAAERAALLTHQLLAFARREVVQPRVLSLNEAIAGMEPILRRTIGEHVELLIHLDFELPTILADPGHIEQVVLNLVINARDAMPSGGTLSIDTSLIQSSDDTIAIDGPAPGRYARLRVSDTGTGMSPEVRDRAFEPFFTTKPKGEGSGLGLATIYGIVSQSGGHTRIYSEQDIGTTVTVLLPATEQTIADADFGGASHAVGGDETILVVEDEEAMREVTRRILARNGYRVIVAANGEEAIAVVTKRRPRVDLLLTDVIMPKLQGKALAEEVTRLRPHIQVLFMSGYAQPVLGTRGNLEPGMLLVEKPFTEALLLAKVREALQRAHPSSAE